MVKNKLYFYNEQTNNYDIELKYAYAVNFLICWLIKISKLNLYDKLSEFEGAQTTYRDKKYLLVFRSYIY